MALVKKGSTSSPSLALLLVMAMVVFSPCRAADYCHAIVPCDDTTCFEYCQNHDYKNFQTYCTPGKVYPICCCRVPDE